RNDAELQARVLNSALTDFPVIGDQLRQNVRSLNETGPGLAIGLAGALLGARGVANSAQNALNTIWGVPKAERPGFPWNLLRSLGLLALVGGFALANAVLAGLSGGSGVWGAGLRIAAIAGSLLVNIGLFVGGFRLATAPQVRT